MHRIFPARMTTAGTDAGARGVFVCKKMAPVMAPRVTRGAGERVRFIGVPTGQSRRYMARATLATPELLISVSSTRASCRPWAAARSSQ